MAWNSIRGHQRFIDAFRTVIAKHRLAHAYLFVGPPGIGKLLFAREFAKAFLCETPSEFPLTACDRCAACRLVEEETHPDFFTLRRPEDANELPVELMRELCRSFTLKTARGHGKVAIVENADELNEETANCFLKTLEEPPPRSVFLLIGTSREMQLPTILSRCQTLRFSPLPKEDVRAILQRHEITEAETLDRLVRLSAGSPGQALDLADTALWQFRHRLMEGLNQRPIESIVLAREFGAFVEEAGKEGALQRRRALLMIRLLLEGFSDALALNAGSVTRSTDSADLPALRTLAEQAQPELLMSLVDRCLETEGQINRYIQLSLVFEGLLDALAQILESADPVRTPA